MPRRSAPLSTIFVGFAIVAVTTKAGAQPETPDRPGRPTQDQAAVPTAIPASQPIAPLRPTAAGGTAESDDEFLKETAAELDVPSPAQRPDLQALRWFGLRPLVEEKGITFAGTVTADLSRATQGFNTRTDDFRHLLDARINVDTKALFGLTGGTFSIDFQNQNGRNGSSVLGGDVQGFDNADADGRTQISELWYQQAFLNEKVRVKVGKVDANSEFAFAVDAAPFINSSFGHAPTIVAMPTYPDPATSVNVFVYPVRGLSAGFGIYDGSKAAAVNTGDYGPRHFFQGHNGYFMIGEVTGQWALENKTLPGRVSVGGWGSTSDFARFDGQIQGGTGGVYAIAEQTVYHKKYYTPGDPQGVNVFLQYGHGDRQVSGTTDYVGTGVTWTGPLADLIPDPARQTDDVGVALAYARLSTAPGAGFSKPFELSAELFYGLQLTPYLLLKPDVQYIVHPGYAPTHDAVLFTIRATVAF